MALGLFMLFTLHPLLFLSHSGILQADLITWALGMATARFYRSTVAPWFTCLFSRAPSLGKRPTVYSQICLCFTQIFFFSNCTLFTSETKTWKLSWSVNARAYPTSFHTELILLLLHSRADLIHHVYQGSPPSYALVLYLELYLHEADTLICS